LGEGKKINKLILSLFILGVERDSVKSVAIDSSISTYSGTIYQELIMQG